MAEEKKTDKKPEKKNLPIVGVSWEEVLLLILGIVSLLFVLIPQFSSNSTNDNQIQSINGNTQTRQVSGDAPDLKDLYNKVFSSKEQVIRNDKNEIVQVVKNPSLIEEGKSRLNDLAKTSVLVFFSLLIFLILLFNAVIYYNNFKKDLIVKNYKKNFIPETKNLNEKNEAVFEKSEPDNNGIINPRWQIVGRYYNSANQSDWKLAILEADIMLFEVLSKSGFPGITIGEMLKSADKSKLRTLDEAWSAHKIRNEIAHQGTDYVLSRTKVEEAISNYEKVFEELNFI